MSVEVVHGDSRRVLARIDDCSVDAVVTDPPYELGFMGKAWDSVGVAYDVRLWAEVLRVLKPGGHLLAFGGTRTYHRMACAIEDVGFEIRDSLHWLYGSGFPKSLDVSKAIDKAAGAERDRVPYTGGIASGSGNYGGGGTVHVGTKVGPAPATDAARQWSGWGTALKPAHEPIVVARKPLVGTVAGNVLEHGTGALNIDGCRVGYASDDDREAARVPQPSNASPVPKVSGVGRNGEIFEPAPGGRWPANLVFTHAADCGEACAEGCPVAELDGQSGVSKSKAQRVGRRGGSGFGYFDDESSAGHDGVWPADPGGGASRFFTVTEWDPIADVAPFRYVAKPSKRERNAGLDGMPARKVGALNLRTDGHSEANGQTTSPAQNHHPTVKPVALMRWLVRLVTPPGGTVLDPFAGSGTTLVAAVLEGFDAIGIEMTDDYLPIIEGRIAWAEEQAALTPDPEPTLFDGSDL